MANKTIGELTAGAALGGTELFHGVQSGNSRKFTADQVRGMGSGGTAALAEGDILYVNASKELTRLPKGSAGQILRQNSGSTAPEWVDPAFSKSFKSAEQTITAGSGISLTHGLGVAPKLIYAELICKTAEFGYSVGDIIAVPIMQHSTSASDSYGMSVRKSSSSINIVLGVDAGVFVVIRLDNAQGIVISPSSWRLIVSAWA